MTRRKVEEAKKDKGRISARYKSLSAIKNENIISKLCYKKAKGG